MRTLRELVPDLMDRTDDDESERSDAHYYIFGHRTIPGRPCEHEVHAKLQYLIEGAELEIPFDPNEVISSDSVYEQNILQRAGMVYADTRALQQSIEEEDARLLEIKRGIKKVFRTS